jgi:C4-dicarboxylate transporter/malic acid transport protein
LTYGVSALLSSLVCCESGLSWDSAARWSELKRTKELFMFRRIVKHFGPEWGAAVMGTAAISITMQLSSEVARPFSALLYIGIGYYLLATLMFVTFLVPWTLRFFWYPEEVRKDLAHPVRGNFFPTMPISFILAGTGTNKLGPLLFGPQLAYTLGVVFFFVGALGIFTFGFLLLRSQFLSKDIALEHANFAWFIPPVSHLIIPVLGACAMDVHWAETPLAPLLFIVSMIALGVGFFNFLFVGAAIWHRYIYASIPAGQLAPTVMVGIAPTAIMVVFLMKFAQAIEAAQGALYGIRFAATFPVIKLTASVLWGFSAWWLAVALILFLHYVKHIGHPVAFAWWAYTFPFEAFVVATGLLGKVVAPDFLHVMLETLNVAVVVIWAVVVFGTFRWLRGGAYFAAH